MIHKKCLNCGSLVDTPYCPKCGQDIRTHRFRFDRDTVQEALSKIFNVENGALPTLRDLFVRPGKMIRAYLHGARRKYMNYLSLLLLLLVADYLLNEWSGYELTAFTGGGEAYEVLDRFLRQHAKFYLLILLPVNAIFTRWFFRKARYNFAEHLILNAYRYAGETVIGFLLPVLMLFTGGLAVAPTLFLVSVLLPLVYAFVVLYHVFYPAYRRKFLLVLRSMLCVLAAALTANGIILLGLAVYEGIKQASAG